jgi:DNA-binding transcriptional regulator/RsmH inhibitor MraZ
MNSVLTQSAQTSRNLSAGLLLVSSAWIYGPPAWADRVEKVRIFLHEGKDEQALKRCLDWEAYDVETDSALRDVCAQAAWRPAELRDDFEGWKSFRETWDGTKWADLALERESTARLSVADESLSESDLRALSEAYSETSVVESWRQLAASAAVREIGTGEDALRVARDWPEHVDLNRLVSLYPESFLVVQTEARDVRIGFVEGISVKLDPAPTWRWMAQDREGHLADWDSTVVQILRDWGVQSEVLSALPTDTGLARLPICEMQEAPAGWHPVLELRVGETTFLHSIPPDSDCSSESWPVLLSREGGQAVGLSLRPGHRVDLRSREAAGDVRDLVRGGRVGDVVLGPDGLYQQMAAIQVVQPLSGGAPWTTLRSAGQWSQPLGEALYMDPMAEGWELVPVDGLLQVRSDALAKMPPAFRVWNIVPGDVSVIPLQMRGVIGMTTARATPPLAPAPKMTPASGWIRTEEGGVDTKPPQGARTAGLYRLQEEQAEVAEAILAAMSLTDDSLFIVDGWRVNLDDDLVEETVLRAGIEGEGVVFVLDLVNGERPLSADNARVFGWNTAGVGADGMEMSTPFPFQKGGYTYLAWVASSGEGVSIEVVRTDGTGFVSDRFSVD